MMDRFSNEAHRGLVPSLVVALAFVLAGAECGHDGANGDRAESAGAEQGAEREKSGSTSGEKRPDERREAEQTEGADVMRSDKQRITAPDASEETVRALVEGNTSFGFELYEQLRGADAEANLFFSPYNLSSVLAMVYAGAEGETRAELRDGLHFLDEDDDLHAALNAIDTTLQSEKASQKGGKGGDEEEGATNVVESANGIWAQKDLTFKETFLDALALHYGAGVHQVDFREAAQTARETINEWVEEKTRGKIADLIPEGAVDSQTRAVLTAALYFQRQWLSPFDENATKEEEFANRSGESTEVEMMYQKERDGFEYAEGESYVAVELPYGENAFSMVVVLPDEGSFDAVEGRVDAEFVLSLFDDLAPRAVELELPKFELTSQFSASKHLAKLGVKTPFTRSADFSGMTSDEELLIDDVLHKAYVSVDEKGTEAAAASAVAMRATSLRADEPQYEKVTVDRPFLFVIRHRETDTVLFVGRVVEL